MLNQDEDEVDQGTMVRAGTSDMGTIREAGSLGSTARTMIEQSNMGTMESQLGTMVINSDEDEDEEAGTMKRKRHTPQCHSRFIIPCWSYIAMHCECHF